MIPKELGPWRIGKELGKGEFSSVYECTLKNGSQDYLVWAMKLSPFAPPPLKSKEKKDQTCCRLLGWENQIYSLHLKNATCPSFPRRPDMTSYGANEKGWRYLVMERFDGGTLKDRMSKNEIPHSAAFSAAIRVLMALRHLHSRQFLFRDLKPENIMTFASPEQDLEGRGVVLVDFGACTKFVDSKGDHFTDGSSPVGTPLFMSVNVHSMGPPTRRDDLESLGYLLGWMLNRGQLPWSTSKSEVEISNAKRDVKLIHKMCANSPELALYMEKVRLLDLEATPDYEMLIRILVKAGGTSKGPILFQKPSQESSVRKNGQGRRGRRPSTSMSPVNDVSSRNSSKRTGSRKMDVERQLEDNEDKEEDQEVVVVKTKNAKRGSSKSSSKSKSKTKNEDDEAYDSGEEDDSEDDMDVEGFVKTKRTTSRPSTGRLKQKKKKGEDDEAYKEEEEEDEEDEEDEVLFTKTQRASSNREQQQASRKSRATLSSTTSTATTKGRASKNNSKQLEEIPTKQRTSLIARASEKATTTTTTSNKRTRRSLSSDGTTETTNSRRRSSSSSSSGNTRATRRGGSRSGSKGADEEEEDTNTTSRVQPMRSAKEMLVKAGVFLSAAAILYSGSYVQNNMN